MAVAVQVQPVAADVVGLAGGGVGALVAAQRDVLVGGADGGERQDGDDGSEQPAAGTGRWTGASGRTSTPASASTTGGHTQLSQVMASYPGVNTSSAMPVAPIATAGTAAQRCGRLV